MGEDATHSHPEAARRQGRDRPPAHPLLRKLERVPYRYPPFNLASQYIRAENLAVLSYETPLTKLEG